MENISLEQYNKIFFIGIGGISMSALCQLVLSEGISAGGSDICESEITKHLSRLGVEIFLKHNENNIKGYDLIVFSGAIKQDNPEIIEAKKLKIKCVERSEFLGMISKKYNKVIAIGGVHGKTTTTGMLASVFMSAGLNPTVHIGGEMKGFDNSIKIGGKEFFITEACEYHQSLLHLCPDLGVILNIEEDHPDCYKNIGEIIDTFNIFANQSQNVVVGESYKSLIDKKTITFNFSGNADYTAKNIRTLHDKGITFTCYKKDGKWGNVKLKVFGKHNVYNALATIAISDFYEINKKDIIKGLEDFCGVKRRFEKWGTINNCLIFHDYAHHPTEISATISTAKKLFKRKIVVVFQPHTYSRTKRLFEKFVVSLSKCEKVFLMPVYPAREKPCMGYSSAKLNKEIKRCFGNSEYKRTTNSLTKSLKKYFSKEYCILFLGAGDINKLKNNFKFDK